MKSLTGVALVITTLGCKAEIPIPPTPTHWVTDNSNVMSEKSRLILDDRLREYQERTKHQVIVWIGDKLPKHVSIETYCLMAFNSWGIGREGHDDGVVLFWFVGEKKVRIQVGYGLERKLTDREAARILNETVIPALTAKLPDVAMSEGVAEILKVIEGE